MNVYIYSEMQKKIEKSGVGRAMYHQKKGVELNNVKCVDNLNNADVLHINTVFIKSLFLALAAKRKGIPVVYHAHSTREDFRNSYIGSNLFSGFFKQWLKLCYNRGDVIVTPTEYSKHLLQSYGIKKEIYAVSNGIDLKDYVNDTKSGIEFRKRYEYSQNDKIIMSAGLLIKRKGILDFINLAEKMPEYKFIWFGSSNLYTVGKKVRNAIRNAAPNITFAGYVSKNELKVAYSGCDLFLFPSFEETEGIVVLEALAMKIPVLIRDIPVYSEWLKDGRDVYKANDIYEFEKIARNILSDSLLDITDNGYKIVKQRNIAEIGKKLACIYLECSKDKNAIQIEHNSNAFEL